MSPPAPTAIPASVIADATAGVHDAGLQALLVDHWDATMRANPTWATELGDHRFDDQLPARDAASYATRRAATAALLARAEAIDLAALDAVDATTLRLLRGDLRATVAAAACQFERWSVSAGYDSALGELSYLPELHPLAHADDGQRLLARFAQAPRVIDDTIAQLRTGLADGLVAPAEAIRRGLTQLDTELAKPVDEWAMTGPARDAALAARWPAGAHASFAAALRRVVTDEIVPALRRLRALLADELLPRGRVGAHEGLGGLPDGARCYAAMIQTHLDDARDPLELHALGEREVARTDAALAELGRRALGTNDLASTIARLREDPTLRFADADAIVARAEAALARARAAVPAAFGTLPQTPCVVSIIPDYEAPFSTIAYYRQPHPDGSKPGEYFVNTYQPTTRTTYDFEALTWHESIPGHHLQIALAQERGALPAFRKYGGSTAFVEGWALYTERLADELGLYSGDVDRLGMLVYDAWRSVRLVVDTGLHALGWTRAQAEAYMHAHTALTAENISNEVDRYVTTPGQALAYKVGQLAIFAERARAQAALGSRFDLRAFHDRVLGGGAVTLPVLATQIDAYIASGGAS